MLEIGFLSDKAPLFMDIVSLFFFILPFLLLGAFQYIKKDKIKHFFISQYLIIFFTMLMIALFEVGIILNDSFLKYLDDTISFSTFVLLLLFHIVVAIVSFIGWIILMINQAKFNKEYVKLLFISITITAYSGNFMYLILFVI